jgi:type I restriction enzyme, S subunit
MMSSVQTYPKVFSVSFSALKRWDPNSFHDIHWHWPSSAMATIGSVLSPRKEKVDRSNNDFSDLMPVTIHFDGSIEPRKIIEDKEYSMELFWARPGDIVASKIDLKNGAVAIIPKDWDKAVVTNHFAVYEPNLERLDQKYFHLLIQAKFFKQHLWRNKVGAEGRKEVKLKFFESLEIPIPPLPVQQKIVAYLESAKLKIELQLNKISKAESEISREILASAAIQINPGVRLPKIMAKRFKELDRWGVEFNRYSWTLSNLIIGSSYDCVPLSDFAWVNPSTDMLLEPSDIVSFIPMAAVDDKEGRIVAPKERKVKQVNIGYTRFQEGDVLWAKITPCMQNGKSAIASNLINGIGFGSTEFHVIRSKNTLIIKNEFIHLILRLTEVRKAAMRYFVGSAGQQRVPKDFLEGLYIPIPPLQVQLDILDKVGIEKYNIEKERSDMRLQRISLEKDMEQIILGIRSVEDI